MKALLTWLTALAVAATLAVLAIHLILTAIALIRTNRNLARLADGLQAIRDNTRPLAQDLPAVNGAAGILRQRLAAVDEQLRGILAAART